MKTKLLTTKVDVAAMAAYRKNRRRLITAVVLILISGVILSGAIKMTRATQMDKPDCTEQPGSDSIILEKQETPCPKSTIPRCSLDTETQGRDALTR